MRGTRPPADVAQLRQRLLAWYDSARRVLPWRALPGVRPDPWRVLVSELMLQQTTVATVRARFAPFLARFPTLAALARAPVDDVLHAWQGLGYYRRARALHACAQTVVAHHDGRLPLEVDALAGLPGLGPYTAAAVAAIAGGRAVVPVDANVERVLARMLALDQPAESARPRLRRAAARLASPAQAGDLAQAVMELGALVCTPRRPACLSRLPVAPLVPGRRGRRAGTVPAAEREEGAGPAFCQGLCADPAGRSRAVPQATGHGSARRADRTTYERMAGPALGRSGSLRS